MTSYLRRITPSMAVAILALVVALSSSATAALVISGKQIKDHSITGKDLKKNAVKSKTIKNKSVRGKDLKKNAVKSAHVADRSLTGTDLRAGTITSSEIADGAVSSSKISTTLLQTLTSGASGFQVVTVQSADGVPLVKRQVDAVCPSGKTAISANAYTDGAVDVAGPEIQRTSASAFHAEDASPLSLLGAGPLVLQVTCVSS